MKQKILLSKKARKIFKKMIKLMLRKKTLLKRVANRRKCRIYSRKKIDYYLISDHFVMI